MDIPDLAPFHPEEVAVWHWLVADTPIETWKSHVYGNGTKLLINHVTPVRDYECGRQAQTTSIATLSSRVRVCAAFESRAGSPERNDESRVLESVKVGIACGLDDGASVSFIGRD